MKTKRKENKKKKLVLLITIGMLILVVIFLFYRHFHDQEYRENRCAEDSTQKIRQYFMETGREPEEVVVDMFYEDCMRDAGWLK